ncbi:hypothetical protein SG34_012640 [Thalassomonas viridans]|uniref:Uncharacterized protein n=1 Tax=Thalassomonas viridans TaxID=137584 RepID=A0AAE9Z6K3_9GAMM|nr:hypothetical protein [Thalassomonas viridans]WDE07660.1 hypothetical protein SG34_012640 [Thalassomonas viridans]
MKKTITLLYLLTFVLTPGIASAAGDKTGTASTTISATTQQTTEEANLNPGKYFLVNPQAEGDALQLRLAADGSGQIKENRTADISWQHNGQATEITMVEPLLIYHYEESETNVYRGELVSITLTPTTDAAGQALYHYTGQMRLVHSETGELLESFQENKTLQLINKKDTEKWQLDLVGKEWVIDGINLITHPEEPYFQNVSAARAAFFDNGLGVFTHHDQTISDFKWRVKGRKLIIKTMSETEKLTYVLWLTEFVEDIGVKFVANVRGKAASNGRTRSGYMLMQQDTRFTPENVVGNWSRPFGQYDYYADQIHVPNIVHPASKWTISDTGVLLRDKIVHPELGPVVECPDTQCYLSCTFIRKLIAKVGDTLYFESALDSEFYDQGPVLYQGSTILTAKYKEQNGVEQFDLGWVDYARMQLNDGDSQSLLLFFPDFDPEGNELRIVYQDSPGNVYGSYQVVDGKLHIIQAEQTQVYELQEFNREQIKVCQYLDGQTCEQGSQMSFMFNNNAGPLVTD